MTRLRCSYDCGSCRNAGL